MSDMVENPEDWFSHNMAHIVLSENYMGDQTALPVLCVHNSDKNCSNLKNKLIKQHPSIHNYQLPI